MVAAALVVRPTLRRKRNDAADLPVYGGACAERRDQRFRRGCMARDGYAPRVVLWYRADRWAGRRARVRFGRTGRGTTDAGDARRATTVRGRRHAGKRRDDGEAPAVGSGRRGCRAHDGAAAAAAAAAPTGRPRAAITRARRPVITVIVGLSQPPA